MYIDSRSENEGERQKRKIVLESFQKESEIDTRSEMKVKGNKEQKIMENAFRDNRKQTLDQKMKAKDNIEQHVIENSFGENHKNTHDQKMKAKDNIHVEQYMFQKNRIKRSIGK